MKSTGLFGKNSGRIGGVVYSNYRGEQIVRAYQPKVNNPNTKKQVEQRAKFKLVSQVSASLRKEIKMSFVPTKSNESSRNAFMSAMLKKTTYSNNQATLPIEDIVLTNSSVNGFISINATAQAVSGTLPSSYGDNAKVRIVFIGYNDGGEITQLLASEPQLQGAFGVKQFTYEHGDFSAYTNVRALAYVYEPDENAGTTYQDYETLGDEATLNDILQVYSGKLNFSATANLQVPRGV